MLLDSGWGPGLARLFVHRDRLYSPTDLDVINEGLALKSSVFNQLAFLASFGLSDLPNSLHFLVELFLLHLLLPLEDLFLKFLLCSQRKKMLAGVVESEFHLLRVAIIGF